MQEHGSGGTGSSWKQHFTGVEAEDGRVKGQTWGTHCCRTSKGAVGKVRRTGRSCLSHWKDFQRGRREHQFLGWWGEMVLFQWVLRLVCGDSSSEVFGVGWTSNQTLESVHDSQPLMPGLMRSQQLEWWAPSGQMGPLHVPDSPQAGLQGVL